MTVPHQQKFRSEIVFRSFSEIEIFERPSEIEIFESQNKALCKLRSSKDLVVRLQDMGSRLVILDRNDYIDKVERNLNDGSFDILGSDPSLSYYHIVKNIGEMNGWKKVKLPSLLLNAFLMPMQGQERTMV